MFKGLFGKGSTLAVPPPACATEINAALLPQVIAMTEALSRRLGVIAAATPPPATGSSVAPPSGSGAGGGSAPAPVVAAPAPGAATTASPARSAASVVAATAANVARSRQRNALLAPNGQVYAEAEKKLEAQQKAKPTANLDSSIAVLDTWREKLGNYGAALHDNIESDKPETKQLRANINTARAAFNTAFAKNSEIAAFVPPSSPGTKLRGAAAASPDIAEKPRNTKNIRATRRIARLERGREKKRLEKERLDEKRLNRIPEGNTEEENSNTKEGSGTVRSGLGSIVSSAAAAPSSNRNALLAGLAARRTSIVGGNPRSIAKGNIEEENSNTDEENSNTEKGSGTVRSGLGSIVSSAAAAAKTAPAAPSSIRNALLAAARRTNIVGGNPSRIAEGNTEDENSNTEEGSGTVRSGLGSIVSSADAAKTAPAPAARRTNIVGGNPSAAPASGAAPGKVVPSAAVAAFFAPRKGQTGGARHTANQKHRNRRKTHKRSKRAQ